MASSDTSMRAGRVRSLLKQLRPVATISIGVQPHGAGTPEDDEHGELFPAPPPAPTDDADDGGDDIEEEDALPTMPPPPAAKKKQKRKTDDEEEKTK
jgi:hypothetical protein